MSPSVEKGERDEEAWTPASFRLKLKLSGTASPRTISQPSNQRGPVVQIKPPLNFGTSGTLVLVLISGRAAR